VTGCSSVTSPGSEHTARLRFLRSHYSSLKKLNSLLILDAKYLQNFRMFVESCKRLRIMKGSEAIGLGK
jgi:hypothetical protein